MAQNEFDKLFENQPSITNPRDARRDFQSLFRIREEEEEEDPFFERSALEIAKDTGASIGLGFGNLTEGVGVIYGLVSGDMDNAAIRVGSELRDTFEAAKSETLKEEQREFQRYINDADSEMGKFGRAVVGTLTSPSLATAFVLEQVAPLVATGGTGAAVRGGALAATKIAAPTAAKLGTGAAIGTGSALGGADLAGDFYNQAMQLPEELLMADDGFRERAAILGFEEAKKEVALDGARNVGMAVTAISGLSAGVIPNTIEKTLLDGAIGDTFLKRSFGTAGAEASQELAEEGGGQLISNLQLRELDPSQDPFEGVGQAAGQALAIGGTTGLLVGSLRGAAEEARQDSANRGGDGLDGAVAASASMATSDLQGASRLRSRMNVGTPNVPAVIEEQQETEQISPRERFNRLITGRTAEPFAESDTQNLPAVLEEPQRGQFRIQISALRQSLIKLINTARGEQRSIVQDAADQGLPTTFPDDTVDPSVGSFDVDANGEPLDQDWQNLETDIARLTFGLRRLNEAQGYLDEADAAEQSISGRLIQQVRGILAQPFRSSEPFIEESRGRRLAYSFTPIQEVLEGEVMPRVEEVVQFYKDAGLIPERSERLPTERRLPAAPDFYVDDTGEMRRPTPGRVRTDVDMSGVSARSDLIEDQNIIYGGEPAPDAPPPPPAGPALIEDQNIIYGQPPEDTPSKPSSVRFVKVNGDPYPTRKSAEVAEQRLQRTMSDYRWSVVEEDGGFALEGVLSTPTRRRVREITPTEVVERAQQDQRDVIQSERQPPAPESALQQEEDFRFSLAMELPALESELNDIEQNIVESNTRRFNTPASLDDDFITAVVKLGGIDIEAASSEGLDRADNPRENVGKYRLFKKDGRSFDEMGEVLTEIGFYQERPPANQVLQDLDDALRLFNSTGERTYRGDRAGDTAYLESKKAFVEEAIDETNRLMRVFNPRNEAGMENAGLTDADILDREEFFTEMFDELYDRGRFRPIERAVPEVDSAPDSPVTRDTIRGTPRAAESQRPRGEERDRAPVPDQDRLDAPRSPAQSDFELSDYSETDIAARESRDVEGMEAREQIDRERDQFTLDAPTETLEGVNQPTQTRDLFATPTGVPANPDRPPAPAPAEPQAPAPEGKLPKPTLPEDYVDEDTDKNWEYQEQWINFLDQELNDESSPLFQQQGIYNLYDAIENLDEWPIPIHEYDAVDWEMVDKEYERILERETARDVKMASKREARGPLLPEDIIPYPAVPQQELLDRIENFEYTEDLFFINEERGFNTRQLENVLVPSRELLFAAPPVSVNYTAETNYPEVSREEAAAIKESWKQHALAQVNEQHPGGGTNSDYIVFSLFDLSGAWSQPWKDAGYQVIQVDIQEGVDVEDMFNWQYWRNQVGENDVYAVIAAPPCTYCTSANNRNWAKADQDGSTFETQVVTGNALRLIEYAKPVVWAMENPVNSRLGLTIKGNEVSAGSGGAAGAMRNVTGLPAPVLNFNRRMFGDPGAKPTSLWGLMNPDMPTARIESAASEGDLNQVGGRTLEAMNLRSVTPEGFAYAFFMANNRLDNLTGDAVGRSEWQKQFISQMFPGGHIPAMRRAIDRGVPASAIAEYLQGTTAYEYDADNQSVTETLDKAEENNLGDVFFQRVNYDNRPPLSRKKFDSTFKRIIGKDRIDTDYVTVVPTFNDLPPDLIQVAKDQNVSQKSETAGVSYQGQIYLVRENIKTEAQLEEVIFHEATHGGLEALLKDKKVNRSLNKLFLEMGGQKGFFDTIKELGIEEDVEPYLVSLQGTNLDAQTRNHIIMAEVIAFTGQKGSKGLRQRILEVIGAVREWLRNTGFVKLAKLTTSDIAALARKAREYYFQNQRARESDGMSAFSLRRAGVRSDNRDDSLYSPAVEILAVNGDRLFKASKKNPEAKVAGEQILAFMKNKGLKRAEIEFTRLDRFLTEDPKRKFTMDEVVSYLQQKGPQLTESVAAVNMNANIAISEDLDADGNPVVMGVPWTEPAIQDSYEYYEYRIDDIAYEISNSGTDFYGFDEIITSVLEKNQWLKSSVAAEVAPYVEGTPYKKSGQGGLDLYNFTESLAEQISASTIQEYWSEAQDNARDDGESFDDFGEWLSGQIDLTDEVAEFAKKEYLQSPVIRTTVMSERDDVDIVVEGNDEIGYVVKIDGEIKNESNTDQIRGESYDLDQIKGDVAQWILENDYDIGSEHKDGDVKVWSYMQGKLRGENFSRYREVTVVLDENPLIEDPDYIAGMSAMPQYTREDAGLRVYEGRGVGHFGKEDLLFNIIVTDRQTDLGTTFVIEEGQSDWQNDIRRAGGTRDPKQYMEVFDRLEALEAEILTYESKVLGAGLGQVIDAVEGEANRRMSSVIAAQIPKDGDFHSEVLFEKRVLHYANALKVIPFLSEKGKRTLIEIGNVRWLDDVESQLETLREIEFTNPDFDIEAARREISEGGPARPNTPEATRRDRVYQFFELERSRELAEVDGEEKNPADRLVRKGMRDNTYVAARNERNEDISTKEGRMRFKRLSEDAFFTDFGTRQGEYKEMWNVDAVLGNKTLMASANGVTEADIVNELLAQQREGRTLTEEESLRIDNALYKSISEIWYRADDNLREFAINDELFGNAIDEVQEYEKRNRRLAAKQRAANELDNKLNSMRAAPPPAPFMDDEYLTLLAKKAVILAIKDNKQAIALSNAKRVGDRWSGEEAYTAIYDGKFKSALSKVIGSKPISLDEDGEDYGGDLSYKIPDSDEPFSVPGFYGWEIPDRLRREVLLEGLPYFSNRGNDTKSLRLTRTGTETLVDFFTRGLQDKFLPVLRVQQAIEDFSGIRIDEEADAVLAEELFYGKTEEDLRQIDLTLVNPLIEDLKKSGLTLEDLGDYMMALHAKERNEMIASRNERMPDGGSGITTEDAQNYLAEQRKDPKRLADLDRNAKRVREMIDLTRDIMVGGGLISEEQASSWDGMFTNWVPLRGFAVDERDEGGTLIPTGRGYSIGGRESKRALGRRSKAANPIVQVVADLMAKTIRFRKNEVGSTFLTLVQQNPDPDFWQVFTEDNPDMAETYDSRTKSVKLSPVNMLDPNKNYFPVKRDGVQYYIKINDKRLLNALRKVGPQTQMWITDMAGMLTRYLSFVNTAGSPEFTVTNFTRDLPSAVLNILSEQEKADGKIKGEAIAARAALNVGKAITAIARYERADKVDPPPTPKKGRSIPFLPFLSEQAEYQQWYDEMLRAGGKTGFFDSPDLDALAKDINQKLGNSSTPQQLMEMGRSVVKFVTDYNTAVENGIRLSTYVEARKAGISEARAASLAKNLTVNFNRKGEWGQALNSWYMFFNAAIQGLAQFGKTMSPIVIDKDGELRLRRDSKGKFKATLTQKIAGAMVASAAGLAYFNRVVGGEDDDGEAFWDKIPPAVRERNLIIMKLNPTGDTIDDYYYKFPLPYGYNFFYNIGDALEGAMNGSDRRKSHLFGGVIGSLITAFSPISLHAVREDQGAGSAAGLTLAPTAFVPGLELLTNTNFFGSQIIREDRFGGPETADAHNYWNSTKAPYVEIAKFMNDTVGGGGTRRSGDLGFLFGVNTGISTDVSPDAIEHVVEFALGGIYRDLTSLYDTTERVIQGREIAPNRIPFVKRLVGKESSDFSDMDEYYRVRQLVINAHGSNNEGTSEERRLNRERNENIHLLYGLVKATDKSLSLLRDRRDRARDNPRISEAERDLQLEAIQERMDDQIDSFNLRYKRHLEKQRKRVGG